MCELGVVNGDRRRLESRKARRAKRKLGVGRERAYYTHIYGALRAERVVCNKEGNGKAETKREEENMGRCAHKMHCTALLPRICVQMPINSVYKWVKRDPVISFHQRNAHATAACDGLEGQKKQSTTQITVRCR